MQSIVELGKTAARAGCSVIFDEPMANHTTFKIGGPADVYITANNQRELKEVIKAAKALEIPVLTIGKGSNMLVKDSGIRGAVVELSGDFTKIRFTDDSRRILECGSALSLAGLCNFAKKYALTGLEFAWGIPGSVGGAVYMNAGAYGGEMANVVHSADHISPDGGNGSYSLKELNYGYRKSIYMEKPAVITSAVFMLKPGNRDEIALTMEDYYNRRKTKQPLNKPSAGSVFKRPEGYYAGSLIEECGLKGKSVGGAQVSEKHAGFIINTGNATCDDVLRLIDLIKETVYKKAGVQLECEVRTFG